MNTTDKTTSNAGAGAESAQVDSVKIEWLNDESPDLSWLDQSDKEMGEGFEAQSKERKESYGQSWEMLGCVATAQVSYSIGGGNRRLETLSSGGVWGIESDSDKSYLREVEKDQLFDLSSHLENFGISISPDELQDLAD
jgi:hypothetical protein